MHPFTKMLNEIQHISLWASLFKIINLQLLIISVYATICLNHWGRVTHICVVDLGHHWFRYWLVACSAPSHYLNLCWNIVYWTFRHKLQWNFNRNSIIFIQEIAFANVFCKMASILSGPQWVKDDGSQYFEWRYCEHRCVSDALWCVLTTNNIYTLIYFST